ncbi:hypothetical protein MKW98_001518 [Papaver atlanticum]|uniref:SAM domain-containing protein n=1 Tax=Papaver atlanticum TaxID=357466 RepID=A0AAD4S8T6_9MAGN|nr:hypothetical protein MKW98_001518 [Papaver atlanticum]
MDGEEGGGEMVSIPKDNYNNQLMINHLQTISRKLTELGNGYCNWFSKQSILVQATVVTTATGIHGAAMGGIVGTVAQAAAHVFPKHSLAIKAKFASPMVEARMFAAVLGTHASIHFIMGNIRGKDDVQTRMAAGFGAGVVCKLVARMGYPCVVPINEAVMGVVCALIGGVIFQLGRRKSQLPVEYTRTKCMLSNLGLENYEKNFEKGLLTDITMPLLTGSILKEVGVPPGPRLLILDHIENDPELQKMRQGRARRN